MRIFCTIILFLIILSSPRWGLAETPSSYRLQTAIDQSASDFAAIREQLDSKSVGVVNSALADLRGGKAELDRQISEWKSVESRASSEKSTVDRLRIEWEIAKGLYEQEERVVRSEQAELDRQLSGLEGTRTALNAEFVELNRDAAAQVRDAEAYDRDRIAFEARKGTKDDPDYSRIHNWWMSSNAWAQRCKDRRIGLVRRDSALGIEDSELRARLNVIFNGTRLLPKRLALSTKERDHVNARAALERLQIEHGGRTSAINGALASAENAARSLSASLAAVPRGSASAGPVRRTDYSQPAASVVVFPAEDASPWEKRPDPRQELVARRTFLVPFGPPRGNEPITPATLREQPFEQIRAAVVRQTLGRYETKPVEAAPREASPQPLDSTSLVRSDLPIIGFGDFAAEGSSIDAIVVDLFKPVEPGAYFTAADYRAAMREQERFATLIPKLEAKLNQVKSWRAELHAHQGDLEELRQETVKNNVANCLAIAPPSKIAGHLAKNPRYAKVFTSELAEKLAAAEKAYEIYQSGSEAWKSKELRDKAEKASETAVSSLEGALSLLPKDDPVRKWAEAGAKAHKILGKGAVFAWRDSEVKNRTGDEVRADAIMTTVEMMAVVSPPVAVGVAVGSEITDWRLRKYYIEPAMDDVRAALSLNFDAEASLRRNLDRAQNFLREEERIINAYTGSSRRAANSLRAR